MSKKSIICLIVGIIGGIAGFIDSEFSRSMCYYASNRSECYTKFSPIRYILEIVFGFLIFYLAALLAIKIISWLKGKIPKVKERLK